MKDPIERQAAIDEWKNDFKEYVNALDISRDDYKGIMAYIDELPSVQPEPFEDAVRRADVVDMLEMYPFVEYSEYETAREVVMRLPSAQPERKNGNWVGIDDDPCETFECDRCGFVLDDWIQGALYNFCPNCGADMRKETEDDND